MQITVPVILAAIATVLAVIDLFDLFSGRPATRPWLIPFAVILLGLAFLYGVVA